MGFASNVQAIWSYSFSEIINNVMDYSSAENLKVIVEQDYLNTSVMIADDGIGIFKKIKEHFAFSSLDEAICELFKGKLTTDSENHSGEGIFFSSKMMDDFFIVSSEKVFTNNNMFVSQFPSNSSLLFKGRRFLYTGYGGEYIYGNKRCDFWIKEQGWSVAR